MSPSTVSNPPSASPRPRWSRRRIAILLGLCAFGGCTTWSLWDIGRSPEWITVTVTVLNDVDKKPVTGVYVGYHDQNKGMKAWVPRRFSQPFGWYTLPKAVATDSEGKAAIRLPNQIHPKERARFIIYVNSRTLPLNIGSEKLGYPSQVQEGKLFEDDEILIRLVPNPAMGMKVSSIPISPLPQTDRQTPESLKETP